jgi:hypothetical protein
MTIEWTDRSVAPNMRERNPNWKGGRHVAPNGYVKVLAPDHRLADSKGYVYEHRLVAEKKLARALRSGEQVHHRNGDRTDNREDNIHVFRSRAHHHVEHRSAKSRLRLPGEPNPGVLCACGCEAAFAHYDAVGRPRRFVSGHNLRGSR